MVSELERRKVIIRDVIGVRTQETSVLSSTINELVECVEVSRASTTSNRTSEGSLCHGDDGLVGLWVGEWLDQHAKRKTDLLDLRAFLGDAIKG